MIEHADAALESWLATIDPKVDVTFEPAAGGAAPKKPVVSLHIHGIRERTEQRDNEITDRRDADGRVIERQRSTRFFDVDYLCTVAGPHRDAHRALGAIIQLLIDHEQVPDEHVSTELATPGHPIDVQLVSSGPAASAATAGGGIVIQMVVPIQPAAEKEIAPPAVELHLDMAPPPGAVATTSASADDAEAVIPPQLDRKWTRVRRREMIAPPTEAG